MSTSEPKKTRRLWIGLAFLAPNIVGFLAFTTIPLVLSMILAFTNWDLRLHNPYKDNPIQFVGFDNFVRLFNEPNFWKYLGNTLFLMMGIPFAIAGSLLAASLLSRNLHGNSRVFIWLTAFAGVVGAAMMLTVLGMGASAITILIAGMATMFLIGGVFGGTTVYRTLFFLPHFTAGVATFLVWKRMYAKGGPLDSAFAPFLFDIGTAVNNSSPFIYTDLIPYIFLGIAAVLLWWGINRLRFLMSEGELRPEAIPIAFAAMTIPPLMFAPTQAWFIALLIFVIGFSVVQAMLLWKTPPIVMPHKAFEGLGNAVLFGLMVMVGQLVLIGLSNVSMALPGMAGDKGGLEPPGWLTIGWAKPSIMIMALWAAIGSNNMLLYLAALSNIPQELYEAADIDGARPMQKFWNVTWPQLAPTTFFIVIMSVIGGIQGGFEMARTMTEGGPAGDTTTLSYFIYIEGFETGALGYASAIAWIMFLLVFIMTLINWRVGSQYVNE